MSNLEKALALSEQGMYCFPVNHTADNEKKPYTPNGHLDATLDPNVLMDWWMRWPDAKVGVYCGKSGIVVCDVDTKNGKDGWTSLDEAWVDIPPTFSYETGTGGSHLVYADPGGLNLDPKSPYRGLEGVDRRAGSSWSMWVGPVPDNREVFSPAPEWLLDEAKERSVQGFEGTVKDWYDSLTPGEPNVMVRRAIKAIQDDMGHSDMVSATYEAIRLGSEGNPGVPDLVEALEEAWMNRPAENHTTPESAWEYKFQEALLGGLEKYGQTTELFKNLPEYNIAMVPASIPDALVTSPGTKADFSKLLGALVKETEDDNRILSILWNCNGTKKWAREWGLEFCLRRIQDARHTPEPTRENPRIEEALELQKDAPELTSTALLTSEEREYIEKRPTFVDNYLKYAREGGFVNEYYARAAAWNVASLAFAFHGFIPQDEDDNMGLNLWSILLGESGTGKTRATKFMESCLDLLFADESKEGGMPNYNLGAGSSMEGVHEALLQRDRKASMFFQDEASEFFAKIKPNSGRGWLAGYTDALSRYYEGSVPAENKVRLKELKGKSAITSMNLHMYATPDRFLGLIERDMFGTGFVPRINWVIAPPPVITKDRFRARQARKGKVTQFGEVSTGAQKVVADLIEARSFTEGKPTPLFATDEALDRLSEAHERMYRIAEKRENWDIISPVITRLAETLRKCSGICAMYRSDDQIELVDALHAINAVEEWFENVFKVAATVSEGDFQRACNEIESWVRDQKGGRATSTKIKYRFNNLIKRDPRELDSYLTQLVESGIFNRKEEGGVVVYELNGRS